MASLRSAGRQVSIRMPTVVYSPESISVGDYVAIGEFCLIRGKGGLSIGSRVLVASHVVITTQGHPVAPPRWGLTEEGPISIGDDVWIGAGAIILPNVRVGSGSVIAAGAVVTRDVPDYVVAAGVPAHVTKRIDKSAVLDTCCSE